MNTSIKLNWFDWFLILGVVATSAIISVTGEGWDTLGFAVALTGIINLVLCAKGNLLNYAFGIVYNAIYVYIAYSSALYADAATYLLYYLPMQFIGWFQWKKNRSEESGAVKARHLSRKQALAVAAILAVTIPLLGYILSLPSIGDAQPYKDAATTVASFMAMFLMVKAFAEQWYIWIALDAIQVVKWSVATVNGEAHAAMMLIMFAFYTANAIYGFILWRRLSKNS